MITWYIKVDCGDKTKEVSFYVADVNPIEEYPERFGHEFVELGGESDIFDYVDEEDLPTGAVKKDDIRLVVDELDSDTEYWIIDAHDELGSEFPSVPDVPNYSRPSYFVGVPRDKVVDVYPKSE